MRELRFAPQSHGQKGMCQEQAIQAVLAGMQEAPIPSRLILCAMRGADNEAANRETVQLAARYLGRGVAALDLAGAEAIFPTAAVCAAVCAGPGSGGAFCGSRRRADGPESVGGGPGHGAPADRPWGAGAGGSSGDRPAGPETGTADRLPHQQPGHPGV